MEGDNHAKSEVNTKSEGPSIKEEAKEEDEIASQEQHVVSSLPAMDITPENFKEVAHPHFCSELKKFGGAAQYLRHHCVNDDGQIKPAFGEYLLRTYERNDISFHGPSLPQMDTFTNFPVRLVDLGFFKGCSSKPDTMLWTSVRLVDEYLLDGFVTANHPLLLYQGPVKDLPGPDESSPWFWTHYVKGAARATTALFVAHVCFQQNWDLQVLKPILFETLQLVHCRVGAVSTDATTIALENAKLSNRGSICKPHDVITWLGKLHNLSSKGFSAPEILKKWNSSCATWQQIQGQKRTALMNLLKLPQKVISLLLSHVSTLGQDGSAFAEDAWQNKKLTLGYVPRAAIPKIWQQRMTVTEAGLIVAVQFITEAQKMKPEECRGKWDRSALEGAVASAQLLTSLISELREQVPVQDTEIESQLIQPFLEGDSNLDLALQAALAECKQEFTLSEIKPFKDLLGQALARRDGKAASLGAEKRITAGQLEKDAFNIVMTSLKHDVNLFLVWCTRCQDRDNSLYYQRLQHTSNRHTRAREIGKEALTEKSQYWQLTLVQLEETKKESEVAMVVQKLRQKVESIQQNLVKVCHLQHKSEVRIICIVNWANPGTFAATSQRCQATLAGSLVNAGGEHNIGLVLYPVWHYKKGHLFKAEAKAHELLNQRLLNVDRHFALSFDGKNDEREKRALVYPGTIALPMDTDHADETYNKWKTTALFRKPLLTDAVLLQSRDMVMPEDLRDTALPDTSDMTTHIPQGEKHQQVGVDAARKLIASICDGFPEQRGAMLILDCTAHTLEFAKACYLEHAARKTSLPLYYVGLVEGEANMVWSSFHLQNWLANGFLDESVPLPPGASLPPVDLPPEMVGAAPPKPDLTSLCYNAKVKTAEGLPSLRVPDKIMTAWHDHATFGGEFKQWLTECEANAIPINLKETDSQNTKRAAAGQGENPSGPKRGKTEATANAAPAATNTIAIAEMPSPLVWESTLSGPGKSGNLKLVVTVGQRIFIVNDTDKEKSLPQGNCLAGYYKGSFDFKTGTDLADNEVLFLLSNASDLVYFQGKTQSMKAIMAEKRKTSPLDTKVLYHKLVEAPSPEDSSFFKFELAHRCVFKCEDVPSAKQEEDGKKTVPWTHLAGCFRSDKWTTDLSELVWSVKWTARGLQPVRPLIVLRAAVKIQPGQALECKLRQPQAAASTTTGVSNGD